MNQAPPSARTAHDNNFNFLRLLFATLVLVAHAPELVDGDRSRELITVLFGNSEWTLGGLAVAGFFFISGYLILQSWMRASSVTRYLEKRVRRIVPGFWAATLVSALLVGPLGANVREYFSQLSPKYLGLGALFLTEPIVPATFAGQPYPHVNGSMWTIQYEFSCYLAIIGLACLGLVRRRRWYLAFTLGLVVAAALIERHPVALPGARFRYLVPIELVRLLPLWLFFCVGGCFLLFRDRIRFTKTGAVLAAAVLVAGLFFPALTRYCLVTGGAYLLFALAFARIPAFAWFNSKPDISYGVYLYGWPIQKLIHWYLPDLSPWWLLGLTVPLCFACGWASWHLVEKRLLVSRSRRAPVAAPLAPAAPAGLAVAPVAVTAPGAETMPVPPSAR